MPAPLPDAANCISVTLVGLNQGATWMNKINFVGEAPLGSVASTGLSAFTTAIATAWGTNIAPLCNPLVTLTDVNAIELTTRSSPTFYNHLTTPTPGTRTGTPLPTSAAMAISWHIDRRYRGGHGRIYVPAANVADVTNGRTFAGAFQTTANGAATAFYGALDGLSMGGVAMNLIVLSYYESVPDPNNPGHNMTVRRSSPLPQHVTSARVRTRLDSQRRRLGKETV